MLRYLFTGSALLAFAAAAHAQSEAAKAFGTREMIRQVSHQLDDSTARTSMLDKADTFLRSTMKLPAVP